MEELKTPRWSMVISHHPPSQYERTIRIFGLRICVRCFGVAIGIGLGILCAEYWLTDTISFMLIVCLFIATLFMGIEAFVRNETGTRASSNVERIAFGLMIGFLIVWGTTYAWLFLLFFSLLILCGQFYAAMRLRANNVLDKFVGEYLLGAVVEHDSTTHHKGSWYLFCPCDTQQGAMHAPAQGIFSNGDKFRE